MTVRCVMLCTSTIGDSAETVIVSSSAPTFMSRVDRRGEVGRQLDAVTLDVAEPGSVNVTV